MPGTILLEDLHDRANEFSNWVSQINAPPPPQPATAPAPPAVEPPPPVNPVQPALDTLGQAKDSFLSWADQLHAQDAVAPAPVAPTPSDSLTNPTLAPAAPAASSPATAEPPSDFLQWVDQGARAPAGSSNPFDILGSAAQQVTEAAGGAVKGAADTVGEVTQAVTQAVKPSSSANQQSQFGDTQLSADEAYSACGPAAAVRFAQAYGRNPSLREATDLAKSVGWTPGAGMAGIGSEQQLLKKMGIETRLVGRDEQAWAAEATTGNPITISTPGHYFYADGYNADTGKFHVGRSGLDLKGGAEWMSLGDMEGRMGRAQGALFANNPVTPQDSTLARGTGTGSRGAVTETTAGLSGGGANTGNLTERAQGIMGEAAQAASWLGDQGQKALQAILVTEGGMNNARGDQGKSAGPLQFYEGGQLANLAKTLGTGLEQAKTWVEQNPGAAVAWAIGTPDKPGYLGGAIQRGLQQGLSGADLATYAQRTGQVSVSPERAGQNYAALFGGAGELLGRATQAGQDLVRQTQDTLAATQQTGARPTTTTDQQAASVPGSSRSLLEDGSRAGFRAPDEILNPGGIVSSAQQWLQGTDGKSLTQPLEDLRPGGPTANALGDFTAPRFRDFMGDPEQNAQAAGRNVLGALLNPSDQEIVQRAKPVELEAARRVLEQSNAAYAERNGTTPEAVTDDQLARYLQNTQIGQGAAVGTSVDQSVLRSLRSAGLVPSTVPLPGMSAPTTPRGPIAHAVDITKEGILSNPVGRIADVIGNTLELARQPAALTLGGRPQDALAGIRGAGGAVPEALRNAVRALGGDVPATLSEAASAVPRSKPISRVLAASDAAMRTLGESQGMAAEASRLLREAGMDARDPGAQAFLASHAADLYRAGARAGAQSVVGQITDKATGTSKLSELFSAYAKQKEEFLASPRLRDQAAGALMDLGVTFSGVPVRAVEIAASRLPPGTQIGGAMRMMKELQAGNVAGAQQAFGETALESMIQVAIGKAIADGNIRGPDDPEHPSAVRINGQWTDMRELGLYSLPMQVMAAFAEGYEKAGRNLPAGDRAPLAEFTENYGPRFGAALSASMKPFAKAIPGMDMLKLITSFSEGGLTRGALSLGQDVTNRFAPGAARFVENLTDPVARDINRKGVQSLWEQPMSSWPGLAQFLPEKIDPTTGEPLQKLRSGAGMLVGAQQDVSSPITEEANRLNKAGFDITPPKDYPDSVSIGGAEVKLSPDEQRRVTEITGKALGDFASRLEDKDYVTSTEERKAQLMRSYLNAAERMRVAAVRDVIGENELRDRIAKGQKTVGRLNTAAGGGR